MGRKIAALCAATMLLAGCGSDGHAKQKMISVRGTVVLNDLLSARSAALGGANKTTGGCKGLGRYSSVAAGGDVVISDDASKTLTIAKLRGGFIVDDDATMCRFTFAASVPDRDFYGAAVGGQAVQKLSRAEVQAGPTITVGQN